MEVPCKSTRYVQNFRLVSHCIVNLAYSLYLMKCILLSRIFLTGMLVYEGYRLWLWGNLVPIFPILPTPVPDLDGSDIKTSRTSFDTDKHIYENGFTVAPDIDYRTLKELRTVQFVTNTNNLFTQAKDGEITATGLKPEIESVSDQFDSRNSSKLSDLLLLLRLHPKTTHKVNIYIKKKNKETNGKPTAFDIIFNALNSKPQSLTSDLSHVLNSIKPTYGEIPKYYSTVINAETTTVTDQLKQISQLKRNAGKKTKTTTALEITPNTANEDTLEVMQILNDSYKYTRDPRKSERSLTQDFNYLIPNTNSQLTVHEIEARNTNEKIETKFKKTCRPPKPFTYDKNTKANEETETTLAQLFKKVKRNRRSNKLHAHNKLERSKIRRSRLYYTKSYKVTEPKTMELQIVNTTIVSITPSNIVNESNRTTHSLKTTLEIDDDEDEIYDETEVHTQFESEGTTSSPKKLVVKHEFNTPIDNEGDESESIEETEKTPTKSNKNQTIAYFKRKSIEIPKKIDEITTINDEEDETESGEVKEDDKNTLFQNKNNRKRLLTTNSSFLKIHLGADVGYDNIRYEKNHRKSRTPKPFYVLNSTKNDIKETNYIEDESDSAETTSVTTTIGDDPEGTVAEGMDILFILKTRLDKPTAATTSSDTKDLLQILVPTSTTNRLVDHDTSYLDSYASNY